MPKDPSLIDYGFNIDQEAESNEMAREARKETKNRSRSRDEEIKEEHN